MGKIKPTIIEIRNLSHRYLAGTQLEVRSLRDVYLKVKENETVGIIGPSGSGKSTLLQHMNGLFRPMEGDVYVDGVSLMNPDTDMRAVRLNIGLVFQNPEKQLFERYAGDDVAFGPRNLSLSRDEIRRRVREAMNMVGFPFSHKDRLVAEMSQGEKRRLALAGVFALEPQVLVLDEPTSGLDPEGRSDLINMLKRWKSGNGRAIVLASQSMEDVAELSDRIYVIVRGQVILSGTASEVFSEAELLASNGLSLPDHIEVVHELRRQKFPVVLTGVTFEDSVKTILGLFNGKKG
jgi:energy-coupling factor transport system ATP-binding protein